MRRVDRSSASFRLAFQSAPDISVGHSGFQDLVDLVERLKGGVNQIVPGTFQSRSPAGASAPHQGKKIRKRRAVTKGPLVVDLNEGKISETKVSSKTGEKKSSCV